MSTQHPVPLCIVLLGDVRADYVPDSRPPRYTIAGEPCDIDVQIPSDLCDAGWYWHGSTLAHRDGKLRISTATYPPPGGATDQPTCFDLARESDTRSAAFAAARAERAMRPVPKRRPAKQLPPASAPVAQQLAMELV
jgi:hypothetical protein